LIKQDVGGNAFVRLPRYASAVSTLAVNLLGMHSSDLRDVARSLRMQPHDVLLAYRRLFRQGDAGVEWAEAPAHDITAVQTDPFQTGAEEDGTGRRIETVKFVRRMADGRETESVLIPMRRRDGSVTFTLCVSSQVGCAMGCTFCETAQMGLVRNLTAGEIVAQWHAAAFGLPGGRSIRPKNIVFMGMGEPMDNLDEVLKAVRILADHNGAGIASSNITISTVGRIDGIKRVAEFMREPGFHRLGVAISVNAPNDAVRASIMPINRAMPMAKLRDALLEVPLRPNAAFCVEYVLIPGVNDAPEHCDEICAWLKPLRCSLNVIPYNPRRDSPWPAPTEESVAAFIQRAMDNGQFVKRRGTKGRSVMGACGQLGNPEIRRKRPAIAVTISDPVR